jgi:TonB family protein
MFHNGRSFALVHAGMAFKHFRAATSQCLWDCRDLYRVTILLLFPAILVASTSSPDPVAPTRVSPHHPPMEQREVRLSHSLARSSQFVEIQHIAQAQACEQMEPPMALATPDPFFISSGPAKRVRVSFIVGLDGRVHSPLILESAGLRGDRRVLDTVRTWRYRPATCNGVPTETEGKVEFSVR